MSYIKKSIWIPLGFFFALLVCFVGISYKKTPYLINIQYQSVQNPEQDGVEKILVSEIEGVRHCTTENFEYNAERDRYEYVISGEENTYLNLYLNPLQTFRCDLEYRLKFEDSKIAPTDAIIVTLYSGNRPVQQEYLYLFERNPTEIYQPDLYYMDIFIYLFFASFIVSEVSVLKIFATKRQIYRITAAGVTTGIWCLLWCCGMQTGALLEKAICDKFAVMFVSLIVLSVIFNCIRIVVSEGKSFVRDTARRNIPSILFLVITCCVYIPSSLFLGNINEFVMPYHRIAGLIFLYAFGAVIVFGVIGLSIRKEKGQHIYSLTLFFLTMGFYIQSNFLNPRISGLDGEEIDWNQLVTARIYSNIGWGILCVILLVLIGLVIGKNIHFEKILLYLATLFNLMQLCSLIVMLFTCKVDPSLCRIFGKEGEFTVGEQNVIVFLVDCLQVDVVQDYVESADTALEDFTLFTNTVGGGAPTEYAVPLMLTGEEYDVSQDIDEYYDEIWQEGYLLKELQEEKYDVRLYTDTELLKGMPSEFSQNVYVTTGNKVWNQIEFAQKMLQLTNLYMMPLSMKEHFWMDTEDLKDCLTVNGEVADAVYRMDDIQFWEEFQQSLLQKQSGKAFRFYHLRGVHKPYRHDEQFRPVGYNGTDENRTFQGIMMLLQKYMDELKALGVYDNSTIVILGDHGRHNSEDEEKYPAILVKRARECHSLQYLDNPVCFRNLVATIGSEIKDDYSEYGPSLFDVGQESDVQRLQTLNKQTSIDYAQYDGELYKDSETGARFIVDDDGVGNLTYREWNPYEINRISYTYGDVIDFSASGAYADSLTERLYHVENGKTASNELTICFDLPEQKTGDLELAFTYAEVYNDAQKIRIYANGHKVDNVMCTTDQIGKETFVVIPKQYIKEKPVIIRMVFPNAVTPNQLDRLNSDTRVLSVTFDKMWLKVANS